MDEPSVVAVERMGGAQRVVAIGHDAKQMVGRTPENIEAIHPIQDGVIVDFDLANSISIESVLSLGIEAGQVPTQFMGGTSSFGQPPVTLYWHPHFVIDATTGPIEMRHPEHRPLHGQGLEERSIGCRHIGRHIPLCL